jgi:lipoprotein-releasing system permease protein
MLEFFLWLKYVRRARIVLLAVAAVAVSAALMIVVASLFTGFIKNVERQGGATLGDICIVSDWGAPPIPRYDQLIARLEKIKGVKAAAPVIMGVGLVHLGGGNVQQVTIIGIDLAREIRVTNLVESLRRGKEAESAALFHPSQLDKAIPAWIGIRSVAEPDQVTDRYNFAEVDSFIGKQAILITGSASQRPTGSPEENRPQIRQKSLRLEIQGIIHSGHFLNDQNLYIPIAELQKIVSPEAVEPAATRIKIRLAPGADAEAAMQDISAAWDEFAGDVLMWPSLKRSAVSIVTSQQMYGDYFAELHKQMGVLILIFGVISSVGVLLIFCIFYMMVMAKRKDIGIMKSCGAGRFGVATIFLGFAACVGIVGAACGIGLGYLVTKNINSIEALISSALGWKIWRSSIYVFETMPNELDWASIYWIVPAAVLSCLLGVIIPALVAARMKPVDILRYE